jgi:hypothetical protein
VALGVEERIGNSGLWDLDLCRNSWRGRSAHENYPARVKLPETFEIFMNHRGKIVRKISIFPRYFNLH